ncbi:MAG: hypothetical protein ACRCXD_12235 [Luteolibacter sp.]
MTIAHYGKFRFLYLLALAQLIGGPLILLQVTVFCKVALHEAPRMGMATAAMCAWQSADFQAVLAASDSAGGSESHKAPPTRDPSLDPIKHPSIPWQMSKWIISAVSKHCEITDCAQTWTPAWPQAPPGPPPRVG